MHHEQHMRHVDTRSAFEVVDPNVEGGIRAVGVMATASFNNITHQEWVMEMYDRGRWVVIRPPVRLRNRDWPEFVATRPWLRVVPADGSSHDVERAKQAEYALIDGSIVVGGRRYVVQVLPGLRVRVIPEKGKVLVYDRDAFIEAVADGAMLA